MKDDDDYAIYTESAQKRTSENNDRIGNSLPPSLNWVANGIQG